MKRKERDDKLRVKRLKETLNEKINSLKTAYEYQVRKIQEIEETLEEIQKNEDR